METQTNKRIISDTDTALLCTIGTTHLGLYTKFKVDPECLPGNWHCYDLEVKENMIKSISNEDLPEEERGGCVLTESPLTFSEQNVIEIKTDDDFDFLWDEVNIIQYINMEPPKGVLDKSVVYGYGYKWDGMYGAAYADLFADYVEDVPIYTLYPNDTEEIGVEIDPWETHLYGIQKPDWYKYLYRKNEEGLNVDADS